MTRAEALRAELATVAAQLDDDHLGRLLELARLKRMEADPAKVRPEALKLLRVSREDAQALAGRLREAETDIAAGADPVTEVWRAASAMDDLADGATDSEIGEAARELAHNLRATVRMVAEGEL